MNRKSRGSVEDKIEETDFSDDGKKSVEDILAGTQEVIEHNITQAINTYTNFNTSQSTNQSSSSSSAGGRSSSPINSPHSSPQLSIKSLSDGNKCSKSDTQICSFINNNEKIENTSDNSLGKNSDSSSKQNLNELGGKLSLQEGECKSSTKPISKVSDRAKKKSWYSVLYPSYKSRSEDFKKLFKDVPDDERLVVDYSCAVQRDILVHGRLYVSQNYLCFYANIFRWETCLCIKWKDVTSLTKEKTARVIPNAISISAGNDKYFFTSFTTRDKAYLMLFRVWQNALMDKQMQPQEMWQWVHNCYGDELGLTSDDEDYIDPYLAIEENQQLELSNQLLDRNKCLDTSSEDHHSINDIPIIDMRGIHSDSKTEDSELSRSKSEKSSDGQMKPQPSNEGKKKVTKNNRQRDETLQQSKDTEQLPTDMSDSSDSDQNKNVPFVSTAECTSMHEGRQLVHTILPINIDNLFNLLFSKSKFLVDFHTVRKSTDMGFGEWIINEDGIKTRTVKVTVALTQPVGPKTSQVTETQVMRECSQPGELYSIDVSSVNAGIPYAESFCVVMHYCLVRTVDDHTMLSVHAQIKYKKSVWGVVKGFIERNTWAGLEDFYNALLRALQSEYCIPPAKAKGRRPRRNAGISSRALIAGIDDINNIIPVNSDSVKICSITSDSIVSQQFLSEPKNKYKWLSWFVIALLTALILLNVVLLFKLWKLESRNLSISQTHNILAMKNLPKSHKDWVELLKQQEALHESEMRKWQIVLQTAIELLKKVSIVCKTIIDSGNLTEFISNIHHNEL